MHFAFTLSHLSTLPLEPFPNRRYINGVMLHNISEVQHVLTTLAEIWGPLRGASHTAKETQAAESARMSAITSGQCRDRRMTHSDFNHLLSSLKALSPEQMRRLRQQIDSELAQPKKPAQAARKGAKRTKPATRQAKKKPLTRDELNQRLMAAGLITRLPDPSLDIDDDDPDDQPVTIKGEPLSETIIRERR